MWWLTILIAIIVIIYFVYSRKATTVRLSKEQLELMQDLVSKEREQIKKRKLDIINEGARKGETIPLAPILENLENLKAKRQWDEAYIAEIDLMKSGLVEKYGAQIPVDEAYNLLTEYENKHGLT